MKKSLKVKKLIDQNGIEVENFTMVLRLKKIIEELNLKITQQDETIMELKRDSKTTKINEMEVEIQHLNDQNKRLVLLIQEIKHKYHNNKDGHNGYLKHGGIGIKGSQSPQFMRNAQTTKQSRPKKKKSNNKKDSPSSSLLFGSGFSFGSPLLTSSSKKSYPEAQKQKEEQMKEQMKEKKFQKKYYQLLEETQKMKKQLINLKLNQQSSGSRKRKSCVSIDKNYVFYEKNMQNLEKVTQKKNDLEVQNQILKGKLQLNQKKLKEVLSDHDSAQKVVETLKNELKCKMIINSERQSSTNKHAVFQDISNNTNHTDSKMTEPIR